MKGHPIDHQTRCVHYHSPSDVVAIKFRCCNEYYPCHVCHEETAGHAARQWPKEEWNEKAVLCGVCGYEMSVNEYMTCNNCCPVCRAGFNPGCALHYHLYFKM